MAGYFDDSSMLRRVNRERALALSGPRALLMQAAHPLAVSGLLAHSTAVDEPYDRLARTAEVMSTIGFGEREDADRVTRGVRAMHRRVSGQLREPVGIYPAGTPYRADDPELLLWVLFTLVDSSIVVYRAYVGSLSREEESALWNDYKVIGRLFGLSVRDLPRTLADLDDYRRSMLEGDVLHVTDWARERARAIVLDPPVPWIAQPLLETANFITIALLPDRIRDQYGFAPVPPALVRKALVKAGAIYVKRGVVPFLPDSAAAGAGRPRGRVSPRRSRLQTSSEWTPTRFSPSGWPAPGWPSGGAGGLAEAAACPASDFARDAALLALAARTEDVSREGYDQAVDAGELVVAHVVRGAIHALAPGDLALYGRALIARDDDELAAQLGQQVAAPRRREGLRAERGARGGGERPRRTRWRRAGRSTGPSCTRS